MSPQDEAARFYSDELKERGFEAGEPVYNGGCPFDFSDLVDSLNSDAVHAPRVLVVSADTTFAFVVGRLEKRLVPITDNDGPSSYYGGPNWKFEAWTVDKDYNPRPGVYQVRGYVSTDSDGRSPELDIQFIPANPDPEGVIEQRDMY